MPFLAEKCKDIRAVLTERPFCREEQKKPHSQMTPIEDGVQQGVFRSRTWRFS